MICVTAAPRKQPTLSQTITGLKRFKERIIVFAEPGTPRVNVSWKENKETLGLVGNFRAMVKYLVEQTNEKWYLICQDDIEIHKQMTLDFWKFNPHKTGNISFYLSNRQGRMAQSKGWNQHNFAFKECFWGHLCNAYPRQALIKLHENNFFQQYKLGFPVKKQIKLDCMICQCMVDMGLQQWYHNPSLIQHIGKTSTVGNTHGNNNKGFSYSR